MGMYTDVKSRFEAIQQAFKDMGYQRYSGYYVFSPPSGFAIGSHMKASDMNAMIEQLQANSRGIEYASYPISKVVSGDYIRRSLLNQLDQYLYDVKANLRCKNCSNTCVDTCYNGCHNCTGGCYGDCKGCSSCSGCSGCSGNCHSCSGGWWCVKCYGCTGCGGCSGCGGRSGNCGNACQGCTSCQNVCNQSCNVNCKNDCKGSCFDGCSYSASIGWVVYD